MNLKEVNVSGSEGMIPVKSFRTTSRRIRLDMPDTEDGKLPLNLLLRIRRSRIESIFENISGIRPFIAVPEISR